MLLGSRNSTKDWGNLKTPVFPRPGVTFFVVTYPFKFFHRRCYAKATEPLVLQWKTHISWWSWPRFGTENLSPCGPKLHLGRHLWLHRWPCLLLPRLKQFTKTSNSSHIAANKPFLCAPMPCIAISLHTLCSNHGIIRFPTVKLTIPGGHDLVLAPKIWAHVVQNCILDDTCSYIQP